MTSKEFVRYELHQLLINTTIACFPLLIMRMAGNVTSMEDVAAGSLIAAILFQFGRLAWRGRTCDRTRSELYTFLSTFMIQLLIWSSLFTASGRVRGRDLCYALASVLLARAVILTVRVCTM